VDLISLLKNTRLAFRERYAICCWETSNDASTESAAITTFRATEFHCFAIPRIRGKGVSLSLLGISSYKHAVTGKLMFVVKCSALLSYLEGCCIRVYTPRWVNSASRAALATATPRLNNLGRLDRRNLCKAHPRDSASSLQTDSHICYC
jgi:hypothetical protein